MTHLPSLSPPQRQLAEFLVTRDWVPSRDLPRTGMDEEAFLQEANFRPAGNRR